MINMNLIKIGNPYIVSVQQNKINTTMRSE